MNGLTLTATERRRLRHQLAQTREVPVYRRTLALLEVGQGRAMAEVAQMLGVTRQSIYNWIVAYQQEREPSALCDAPRSGRPRLWTEETSAVLRALLAKAPEQFGYPATTWTVSLLQEHLARELGQRLSSDTIRRQLDQMGYAWKRPRYRLASDAEREKKALPLPPNPATPARSVLLAEDETTLRLFPPLRACWTQRGQPAEVRLSGQNARRVVFGTLNVRTGTRFFLVRQSQRGEDFRMFLRNLHAQYRGWQVALLLDEDPSHTAAATQALAADLGIELLWLPKRCPELNPMEHLWGHGKRMISANRQYATIDDQVHRFTAYLSNLSHTEALRKAGVLSERFWLHRALSKNFCRPA